MTEPNEKLEKGKFIFGEMPELSVYIEKAKFIFEEMGSIIPHNKQIENLARYLRSSEEAAVKHGKKESARVFLHDINELRAEADARVKQKEQEVIRWCSGIAIRRHHESKCLACVDALKIYEEIQEVIQRVEMIKAADKAREAP